MVYIGYIQKQEVIKQDFFNKVKNGLEDWNIDGINTLKYKSINTKQLSEDTTLIQVEL